MGSKSPYWNDTFYKLTKLNRISITEKYLKIYPTYLKINNILYI